MAEEEIRRLRRIYTAVQQRDADELRKSVAHDIEWEMPETLPWGGTHHGSDGVMALLDIHQDHVEGEWADPEEFFEAGNRYVVLGRTKGRVRSNSETFEVPFAHLWGLTYGVPSSFRGYFDTAPITAALRGPSEPE